MKYNAFTSANLTQSINIVGRSQLVVDVHQRHQDGIRANGLSQGRRLNAPGVVRLQVADLKTKCFQVSTAVQDGFVFDGRGNDVFAAIGMKLRHTLDGEVVCLSGARGPDNLTRVTVQQICHITAGVFDNFFCLPAKQMRT